MSTIIIPSVQISSRDDCLQLHRAFKGLGCDATAVINILAHRNALQRDDIQQEYETMYSDDLRKHLSSELHGHLKKAILLWMQSPSERDVVTLRQALAGPILDIKAAIEITCSRTSSQIRQIKQVYTPTFGTYLEYDIESHTSGDLKKLLLAYVNTTRYEGPEFDRVLVDEDAKAIKKLREKRSEMDEKILIDIFSERSRAHLIALDSTYHSMYGKELRKVIKKETSGNFKYGLLTILQCSDNPSKYFAMVLRKAMKGLGTDDSTLIRIVITRAELDMQQIKAEYQKKYRKSLTDAVRSETSGHYKTFLLSLLGCRR